MWKRKDINGKVYGRLTAIEFDSMKDGRAVWVFECECGERVNRVARAVTRKKGLRSCGDRKCIAKKMNGLSATKTYHAWKAMLERCENPKHPEYKRYGAIGITVCDEWHTYESFLRDMGDDNEGLYLDREDSHKDYCLENCRWVSRFISCQNTKKAKPIIVDGIQYLSMRSAARALGIPSTTFAARYKSAAPTA